jgi:acyl-CoA thioester hydrolase
MTGAEGLPWELPDPFVCERTVAASEVDRLGHANNANYLRWCEETGWAHTAALDCDFEHWQALGRAMAMTRAELEYKAPCREGDEIAVAVWLVANDERLCATRRFQIVRKADARTVFRADVVYATIDLETGRARRMPEAFQRAYAVPPSVAKALAESPELAPIPTRRRAPPATRRRR